MQGVENLVAAPTNRLLSSVEILHLKRWQYLRACTIRGLLAPLLGECMDERVSVFDAKLIEKVVRGVRSGADPLAQHYEQQFAGEETASWEWQQKINPRHIRVWVRRALRRAYAANQWGKIDLYLCNPYAMANADRSRIGIPDDRPPREMFLVWDVADAVLKKDTPTPEEKAAVWNASFSSANFLRTWFRDCVGNREWAGRDARHHVLDAILRSGVALLSDRKSLVRDWQKHDDYWNEHTKLPPSLDLPAVWNLGGFSV